jgi:hypothetical protein
MTLSIYSFERTELRTLQNTCEGDNEKFLNLLADIVGGQDEKIEELRRKLGMAEHRVRVLEQQISDDSWITNPDRQGGGGWTAEELDPNRGWK